MKEFGEIAKLLIGAAVDVAVVCAEIAWSIFAGLLKVK